MIIALEVENKVKYSSSEGTEFEKDAYGISIKTPNMDKPKHYPWCEICSYTEFNETVLL